MCDPSPSLIAPDTMFPNGPRIVTCEPSYVGKINNAGGNKCNYVIKSSKTLKYYFCCNSAYFALPDN